MIEGTNSDPSSDTEPPTEIRIGPVGYRMIGVAIVLSVALIVLAGWVLVAKWPRGKSKERRRSCGRLRGSSCSDDVEQGVEHRKEKENAIWNTSQHSVQTISRDISTQPNDEHDLPVEIGLAPILSLTSRTEETVVASHSGIRAVEYVT